MHKQKNAPLVHQAQSTIQHQKNVNNKQVKMPLKIVPQISLSLQKMAAFNVSFQDISIIKQDNVLFVLKDSILVPPH